ncbi:MAG TPA: family 16 glycosylhydrolase [Kiritimatiellia bacterium]|nr:family 16 glycosylhydrolase [Kiritimatiellia bacterium]
MNRFFFLPFFLVTTMSFAGDQKWQQIWSDEFTGPAIDATKWRVEDAALVKNNELQYYAPDDVYIEDGKLVIRSQQRAMGDREYTSGLVESKGKFSFLYGRVDIRAKLPRGQGLWPAHWMLPADGSWPPEIDIMEIVGSQPEALVMSLHNGAWPDLDSQSFDTLGPDLSADFHVFSLEWEPGSIRWLLDDVQQFAVTRGVPSIPFYLILNTAVGGSMPGNPDETTVFPQYHVIDYVRVSAKKVPGMFYLITGADGGRVVVSPDRNPYPAGTQITLTAIPGIGKVFDHWEGALSGAENPTTVKMDADRSVRAVFAADPNAPVLLSRGKPAFASSAEEPKYGAGYAVDGQRKTRWSSAFSDNEWLYVDLGEPRHIEAIRISWENAYAKEYALEVSDDTQSWRNIHTKRGGRGGTEEVLGIDATARYVRLRGIQRASEWGYSLWEFDIFGR